MSLETAVQGAKYQSFRSRTTRHLLKRIYDDNPAASEAVLEQVFKDEITRDENYEYLEAAIQYAFKGAYRALIGEKIPLTEQGVALAAEIKGQLIARVREEATILLLDLVMPNGKRLAESTGDECRSAGGFYAMLADKVPNGKLVGEALSEAEVREIWRS